MFSPPGLSGGYVGKTHRKRTSYLGGALPEPVLTIIYENNNIIMDVISVNMIFG